MNFILSLFIFNKENNLCFINPYDLKFFNRHYNLNKKKIFLIPTEGFDKKNIKIKKNYKKNFIFFGRIIKQKGIFDYLEAAKIIKKDFPKLNFYVAGSLSKNIIGQSSIFSKKVFKVIESSNNIKFIKMKKNYSLIYPKMDCLISPSFTEGAGTSVMEAMYSGLFIIAYNNNGHKYLLSSTKNIICKKNNVTELVNQIKFFLNLKTKIIEKIQRHSRQVVLKKFNTKIITIKFNQILKVIM